MIWTSRSDRIRSAISIAFSVSGSSGSGAATSLMSTTRAGFVRLCDDFRDPDSLRRRSARQLRRDRFLGLANAAPIEPLEQSRELRSRQSHHAVFYLWPAELAILEPFGEQADSRAVPEHQLHPIGAFGAEDVDRAVERVGLHDLAHQRRQTFHSFAEVDRARRHEHVHRARRTDHFEAFRAPMIAVTIAASAPRQIQTLTPSSSNSITCGCNVGAASSLLLGGDAATSPASTTAGINAAASAIDSDLRHASRRQP